MTIKRNGDKVILKDGKVSCSCCEEPGECCMYPAQALADGDYTADDLPDDVTVNGTSFPRSGTAYGNTTNGVIFEEDVWAKYTSGVRSSRACLIQGGVEDQFADTYTISGGQLGPIQVTRVSLCLWTGLDSCGNEGYLTYIEDPFQGKLWFADVPNYLEPCERFDVRQGEKIGLQNSPVGNYGNPPYIETVLTVT